VTWIGWLIAYADRHFNQENQTFAQRRLKGGIALLIILGVTGVLAGLVQWGLFHSPLPADLGFLLAALIASSVLAQQSLYLHVRDVAHALEHEGLEAGRAAVAKIVGRDVNALDESGVVRAAIESLAENFSDGIVAPALWLALFGLPGGFVYKAINTADSMIGHRTPRHAAFGFAAAKLDDLINWPAARLAALWIIGAASFVPGASPHAAWRVVRRDAHGHPSPNAGWPEAAMAGALQLQLGGPRVYANRKVEDAWMGTGRREVNAADIRRALTLYKIACLVHMAALALAAFIVI